ncbi:hypothetical protein [Phytohalomonas tamaricis]|uniref:hypothetical protein n=1 Tax=Phytohalomonas tamaricis TaxID=2081032 RepID=UPI001319FF9C|nr:hypothetical protein [Phytohalomonas tamaricis]
MSMKRLLAATSLIIAMVGLQGCAQRTMEANEFSFAPASQSPASPLLVDNISIGTVSGGNVALLDTASISNDQLKALLERALSSAGLKGGSDAGYVLDARLVGAQRKDNDAAMIDVAMHYVLTARETKTRMQPLAFDAHGTGQIGGHLLPARRLENGLRQGLKQSVDALIMRLISAKVAPPPAPDASGLDFSNAEPESDTVTSFPLH